METVFEALLWVGIISGVLAGLGLLAEGVEAFADALDSWADEISSHYVDEP